jgi:hypothetical protein
MNCADLAGQQLKVFAGDALRAAARGDNRYCFHLLSSIFFLLKTEGVTSWAISIASVLFPAPFSPTTAT